MWRIPFNKNKAGMQRIFCSELAKDIMGTYIRVSSGKHNTDPMDIYEFAQDAKYYKMGRIT